MNIFQKNGIIKEGTKTPFWGIIAEYVQKKFDEKYKKLRKCNRDAAFYKLQAALDVYEEILRIPEIIDREAEIQKQNGGN